MSFEERGKALEEAFFARKNQELLADFKAVEDAKQHRQALKESTGIAEDDMLDRILGLGVDAETFMAMSIAPLVLVAWANGSVEDKERQAVMSAAGKAGIGVDSSTGQLLQGWLESQPDDVLMATWKDYTNAICEKLQAGDKTKLCEQLIGRCKTVAEAAGGFLGLGSISAKEQAVIEALQAAFE